MSPSRQATVVIALGSAQTLAWGSTYYLPAILAAPMAADLGLSPGLVFGAFSASLIVAAGLGPVVGRRIDRCGGRDVLAASSLVFAAGLALLGAAQGAFALFAAWVVLGIGMALGLYEAAFSTLARIYGRGARGPITGITLLAGLASTICWPISAYMEAEMGWRAACFTWALAHVLIGLPLNRFRVPRVALPVSHGASEPMPAGPLSASALRSRAMLLLAIVFAATWFTSTALAAHMPRLLEQTGASPAAAVAAAALVGPAQVAARLAEFGVLRRFHPLLSARLAAMAHPLGAVAVLALGPAGTVVFTVLHGAGNGILTIAKGTLPLAVFGPSSYGARQGILMVPARFAQAGAPLLFALLMDSHGAWALLLSIALSLAGFAALLALTPTVDPP